MTDSTCTTCVHDGREAIDADIVSGVPLRTIADRYGVSKSALSRHKLAGHVNAASAEPSFSTRVYLGYEAEGPLHWMRQFTLETRAPVLDVLIQDPPAQEGWMALLDVLGYFLRFRPEHALEMGDALQAMGFDDLAVLIVGSLDDDDLNRFAHNNSEARSWLPDTWIGSESYCRYLATGSCFERPATTDNDIKEEMA